MHDYLNPEASLPIIIAFASPKGGVGKSTTCAAIGGALAHRGYPVRILDLDQTGTLDRWYSRHKPAIPLSVEAVAESAFMEHLKAVYKTHPGFILIDVAGAMGKVMIQAATIAQLTISPAKLSEPDIIEAVKLHREIVNIGSMIEKEITHRLLINEVASLMPAYQKAALNDVVRSGVTRFDTLIHERAAYAEIFSTGLPPHYADQAREPVRKAVTEIDSLTSEILALLTPRTAQAPRKAVA
jgi:chromosome partitioning protein